MATAARKERDILSPPDQRFYAAVNLPFFNDSVRAAMTENNVWWTYENQPEPDSDGRIEWVRVTFFAPSLIHARAVTPGLFRPAIEPGAVDVIAVDSVPGDPRDSMA